MEYGLDVLSDSMRPGRIARRIQAQDVQVGPLIEGSATGEEHRTRHVQHRLRYQLGKVPNADLYQLLAYVTALDLPSGLIIYAQGEADTRIHRVRYSGKRLEVAALDLSRPLDEVLRRVLSLADSIRTLGTQTVPRTQQPDP